MLQVKAVRYTVGKADFSAFLTLCRWRQHLTRWQDPHDLDVEFEGGQLDSR